MSVVATAEHRFKTLGPETVYDAWTDAAALRKWAEVHLADRMPGERVTKIEVDPKVGGRFVMADTREDSEAWGYYRVLEKPRRIVFTWFVTQEEEADDTSVVTVDIVPQGDGCIVTMSHAMDDEWADYVPQTAKAWASMLEAIDKTFA